MNYSGDTYGIKEFIKKHLGDNVDENTIFFEELDLVGHDADEFIKKFSVEFEVDMTSFKFNEYFVEEYNIPFLYWFDRFFRKEKLKRKRFNINHLEKIVKEKKWIDI